MGARVPLPVALAVLATGQVASLPVPSGPGRRLAAAPRTAPGEASLKPQVDALGGEVVRLHARDGLALSARWLLSDPGVRMPIAAAAATGATDAWEPEPHEAILLLHGYSGSCNPDLVEYGPFLQRTASVLGLDFRGHGRSDDGPTTFGMLETEDVGGALDWLGERGITRVALVGLSMGATTALTATAILGDGTLTAADGESIVARDPAPAPRPQIVAIVADSTAPRLELPVAAARGGPFGRVAARIAFRSLADRLGADPRETEPARVAALLAPLPVLLIAGEADAVVPHVATRRLAEAIGPSAQLWIVPGAGHAASHAAMPTEWEQRVGDFLRVSFAEARSGSAGRRGL